MRVAAIACALVVAPGGARATEAEPLIYYKAELIGVDMGTQPPSPMAIHLGGLLGILNTELINSVKREFPCTQSLTTDDIVATLGLVRMQELLGSASDTALQDIGDAFGSAEYLASSKATVTGSDPASATLSIHTTVLSMKRAKAIAMVSESMAARDLFPGMKRLATKLTEELAYYQICPYTGTLKLSTRTTGKETKDTTHPVACNGGDETFHKSITDDREGSLEWNVEKKGRESATADASYSSLVTQGVVVEDGCHRCKSGRQAGWISREVRREASSGEAKATPGTVEITFDRDGTYVVGFKLATGEGTARRVVKRETSAEGSCDVQAPRRTEEQGTASIPIAGKKAAGKGSPFDKVLEFRAEPQVEKQGNEETVIEAEWKLERN